LKQNDKQSEATISSPSCFRFRLEFGRGTQPEQWSTTMIRIAALAVAAALVSLPATAQTKGKSSIAPGQTQITPGQQQTTPGGAKDLAPSQTQTQPGGAKDLTPGAGQKKK
jgi:hypothetical protein